MRRDGGRKGVRKGIRKGDREGVREGGREGVRKQSEGGRQPSAADRHLNTQSFLYLDINVLAMHF